MARNHIVTGAFFKDPPIQDGKQHPIGHMAIEVLGVKFNLAVWPSQTSQRGTKFCPVSGDYDLKETKRLIDITPTVAAYNSVALQSALVLSSEGQPAQASSSTGSADNFDDPF